MCGFGCTHVLWEIYYMGQVLVPSVYPSCVSLGGWDLVCGCDDSLWSLGCDDSLWIFG